MSAAQRSGLIEALSRQELEFLLSDLKKQALNDEGLDHDDPKPKEFGDIRQLYEADIHPTYEEKWGGKELRTYYKGTGTGSGTGTNESLISKETEAELKERMKVLDECKRWEERENKRYNNLRHEAEIKAKRRAEGQIPKSIDASLLGAGLVSYWSLAQ